MVTKEEMMMVQKAIWNMIIKCLIKYCVRTKSVLGVQQYSPKFDIEEKLRNGYVFADDHLESLNKNCTI